MASIRKRQNRWQVQVRRKGQPAIVRSFHKRADADQWARSMECALDRSGMPTAPSVLKQTTLSDLLKRYLAEVTPRKRSASKERYRINSICSSFLGSISLSDLKASHLATFRDQRLQAGGNQMVRHDLNIIGHALKTAKHEWEIVLPIDPMANVKKPPAAAARQRRLLGSELERLMGAATAIAPSYLPDLILFLVETALRKSEALRVKYDDLSVQRRSLRIGLTKNGQPRTIPLSPLALDILMTRQSQNIGPKPFPVHESLLRSHWTRTCKAATAANLNIHDLRHEAVSRLFEKGLTAPEVASISGHLDLRQLSRYAHADHDLIGRKLMTFRSP